jgi:hypothetical protein
MPEYNFTIQNGRSTGGTWPASTVTVNGQVVKIPE